MLAEEMENVPHNTVEVSGNPEENISGEVKEGTMEPVMKIEASSDGILEELLLEEEMKNMSQNTLLVSEREVEILQPEVQEEKIEINIV